MSHITLWIPSNIHIQWNKKFLQNFSFCWIYGLIARKYKMRRITIKYKDMYDINTKKTTKRNAESVDLIIKNCIFTFNLKTANFKRNKSHHVRISFFLALRNLSIKNKLTYICKRLVENNFMQMFRHKLLEIDWSETETCECLWITNAMWMTNAF